MLALRRQANLFRFKVLPADQQLPLWAPSGMLPAMIGAIDDAEDAEVTAMPAIRRSAHR